MKITSQINCGRGCRLFAAAALLLIVCSSTGSRLRAQSGGSWIAITNPATAGYGKFFVDQHIACDGGTSDFACVFENPFSGPHFQGW